MEKRFEERGSTSKKNLYAFQEEALDKIQDYKNAVLFWQMGAGKTVSSIELTERWDNLALVCLVMKSKFGCGSVDSSGHFVIIESTQEGVCNMIIDFADVIARRKQKEPAKTSGLSQEDRKRLGRIR